MGYEIVYGRQFVKTPKGIVPLALFGSSNCYERNIDARGRRRERREREWNIFIDAAMLPGEELLALAEKHFAGKNELWKQNGKWADGNAAINFFKKGIDYALTLEEMAGFAGRPVSLHCYLSVWEGSNYETLCNAYISDTDELAEWIEDTEKKKKGLGEGKNGYISIGFGFDNDRTGFESVNRATMRRKDDTGPVYVMRDARYVTGFDENSMSYSGDVAEALCFESAKDAFLSISKSSFGQGKALHKLKFVRIEKAIKSYAIEIQGEGFVAKKTGKRLWVDRYDSFLAKRFLTEKEAERYAERLQVRYLEYNFRVVTV
jgi:hypothetical protein